jgi:hypothetical protein
MRLKLTDHAYIPTQLADTGDLPFFFGLTVVGALPRFAASVFANRSFALRCWGVCACYNVNSYSYEHCTCAYHDGVD